MQLITYVPRVPFKDGVIDLRLMFIGRLFSYPLTKRVFALTLYVGGCSISNLNK